MNDRDYAIVVGIDYYPGLSSLTGAQYDANAFADWLKDPNGGNIPAGNVHLILTSMYHPPFPNRPTQAHPNTQSFYDVLLSLLTNGTGKPCIPAGRRLYLYFSGHGFTGSSTWEESALYTANATYIAPEHLPGTRFANFTKAAAAFDEIVLVMDCCRDVTLLGRIVDPLLNLPQNPARAATVGTFYAYAVPRGTRARERALEPGGHIRGVFTYLLLDALKNAPADNTGNVCGQAIKNYIHTEWPRLGGDEPVLEVDSTRDLVLTTRNTPMQTKVQFSFLSPVPSEAVLCVMDGQLNTILNLPVSDGRAECRLKPGIYKVSLSGTAREKLLQVNGEIIYVEL